LCPQLQNAAGRALRQCVRARQLRAVVYSRNNPSILLTFPLPCAECAGMTDRILILDFGASTRSSLQGACARRACMRKSFPFSAEESVIRAFAPKAIILSGGPASVHVQFSPTAPDCVFHDGCAGARHLLRASSSLPANWAAKLKNPTSANSGRAEN